MSDAEINLRDVGTYALRMDGRSELTRWPGSPWPLLERGQRITVTHGDFTGEFLVTGITPNGDGGEVYTLEPAEEDHG